MHSRRASITGRFLSPCSKSKRPLRGTLFLALGITLLSAAAASATLVTPDAAFWGSVAIGGSPAPAGTVLSGQVAGVELAVHVLGSESPQMYRLRVPLSQAAFFYDAPLPGTAFPGQSVQIFLDGRLVAEEVLAAGELTRLDLNDTGSPPATFTATPLRPTPTITPTRPAATATRTRTRVPSPTGAVPTGTGVVAGTPTRTSNASPTPTPTGATATPTSTITGSATVTPTGSPLTATPTPTATLEVSCSFPCTGDCNGNCQVTINEMILSSNLSLSGSSLDTCLAGDPNHDGRITIAELIAAVNRALNGCPAQSP